MDSDDEREAFLLNGDEEDHSRGADPAGYYATLGVAEKATMADIRKAFLHFSQRYHTDKHSEQSPEMQDAMNERFQQLQEAYSVLSDEKQRAAYDAAGCEGTKNLALVPASVVSSNDVISYIRFLEREARIIRTAKMLSATSNITLNYSIAHLFLPSSPFRQHRIVREEKTDLVSALNTPQEEETPTETPEPAAATPAGDNSNAAATPAAPPGAVEGQTTKIQGAMVPMVIQINGKEQVVLLPPQELQDKLRGMVASAAQTNGSNEGAPAGSDQMRVTKRRLSVGEAIAYAIVPKSMSMQHSFQHAITPNLGVQFKTDCRSKGTSASVSLTTEVEYDKDKITSYVFSLRTAVTGLKSAFVHQRVLSPLWKLRQKWTLLSGGQILQKVEYTLIRKLSTLTELQNSLAWSLYDYGHFKTTIERTSESGQQSLNTFITSEGLNFSAYSVALLHYGGAETRDPKIPAARGKVQYSLNCSPFTGQTHVGFEAWYFYTPLQQFGLSFMSVVPYSFSPVAPPFFLVESSQFAVVNQVSLLYARGKHRISVPIIFFMSTNVRNAVLWLTIPLTLYRFARLLYRPYSNAKVARYYLTERKKHLAEMDISRQRALLEQHALELCVLRGRAEEDAKGGLVIINGQYGVLESIYQDPCKPQPSLLEEDGLRRRRPWLSTLVSTVAVKIVRFFLEKKEEKPTGSRFGSSDELDVLDPLAGEDVPLTIDVTLALQNMVRDSALILPAGSKSKLVGFCDPDPYTPEAKQLKIVYWFNKKRHAVIFNDEDSVVLPQRDHLVAL